MLRVYHRPMSAKDRFHEAVKTGLIKDGWTITHDPLFLDVGVANELVDFGVPKHDIVLAYHAPTMRQYDGFAVG